MHPRSRKSRNRAFVKSLLTSLPAAGGEADAPTFFVLQKYYTCRRLRCQLIFCDFFIFSMHRRQQAGKCYVCTNKGGAHDG